MHYKYFIQDFIRIKFLSFGIHWNIYYTYIYLFIPKILSNTSCYLLLIKSIPIVTLKVCLGHASQPNGDLNCYMMYLRKNTLDSFKICWTRNPQQYLPLFWRLPPFFFNSNKRNRVAGPPALQSCWPARTTCEAPGQCEPGLRPHRPRERCPTDSCCLFFLRHCSSDPGENPATKIHQSNKKKRHKRASSVRL